MSQSTGSTLRQAVAAAERHRASEEQALTAEYFDHQRQLLESVEQQICELEETRDVALSAYSDALRALHVRRHAIATGLGAASYGEDGEDGEEQVRVPYPSFPGRETDSQAQFDAWVGKAGAGPQQQRSYGTG